ncbi:MAG: hypothetical protein LBG81_08635 [Coriobacteriaceae bacterium]|nr:hypothetical protein [Coriobacteriaceae bacterium]
MKIIAVGLGSVSLLEGIVLALGHIGAPTFWLSYGLWLLLLAFAALTTSRRLCLPLKNVRMTRFLVLLVCGMLLLWFQPWDSVGQLALHARNLIGYEVAFGLASLTLVLSVSGIIFCLIGVTFNLIPRRLPLYLTRLFLVVAAVAVTTVLHYNVVMLAINLVPETLYWLIDLIGGFTNQAINSVAYGYVINGYLGETRSLWPRTQTDAQRD